MDLKEYKIGIKELRKRESDWIQLSFEVIQKLAQRILFIYLLFYLFIIIIFSRKEDSALERIYIYIYIYFFFFLFLRVKLVKLEHGKFLSYIHTKKSVKVGEFCVLVWWTSMSYRRLCTVLGSIRVKILWLCEWSLLPLTLTYYYFCCGLLPFLSY